MKYFINYSLWLFLLLMVSCSSLSNHGITGEWRLVKEGQKTLSEDDAFRTCVFSKKGLFKSTTHDGEINRLYNMGRYYMLDDSTFITIHTDSEGRLAPFTQYYNFKIENDILHFYGFYIQPQCGGGLKPFVVNQWWRRTDL